MLQLCAKQSKTPYYIEAIDTNIYSMEELSYYIYNHVNLIYREFFSEQLFTYIENELCREDLAQRLREMDKENASIQDFIMYILKGAHYYSASDLANISPLVFSIDSMSRDERLSIEADSLFKDGRYGAALHIYFEILNNYDGSGKNSMFYGRIAFAIGVVYARLFMSKNANSFFSRAYEIYPDPVYAKACVYMSIINHDDEELLHSIVKYKVSDDALGAIQRRIEAMEKEIEREPETKEFFERLRSFGERERILDEWKDEYHRMQN